ncbi:hypothetical protein LXA43DRAFT_1087878 [Ganoderma leucocontextum]|nr:hypothetical protein LXA43DRAFT_1087878 [Ganoderma leucocontextum]
MQRYEARLKLVVHKLRLCDMKLSLIMKFCAQEKPPETYAPHEPSFEPGLKREARDLAGGCYVPIIHARFRIPVSLAAPTFVFTLGLVRMFQSRSGKTGTRHPMALRLAALSLAPSKPFGTHSEAGWTGVGQVPYAQDSSHATRECLTTIQRGPTPQASQTEDDTSGNELESELVAIRVAPLSKVLGVSGPVRHTKAPGLRQEHFRRGRVCIGSAGRRRWGREGKKGSLQAPARKTSSSAITIRISMGSGAQ